MERPQTEWLLTQHRALAARAARHLGPAEAEDVASEVILRILRHPSPDGRHGPWLERIFQNLLTDRRRARARQQVPAEADGPAPTPEDVALANERRRRLADALPSVPPPLREALRLHFVVELDYAEVSREAAVPVATARTRVHRGVRWLRELMSGLQAWLPPLGGSAAPAGLALWLALPAPVPPPVFVAQVAPVAPATRATPAPVRALPRAAPVSKPRQTRPVSQPATTRYDFEDDEITTELQRPPEIHVTGTTPAARPSLIEIPSSFIPAIIKSTEEL